MTPTATGLAPELIEQVEKLTPEQRDKLRDFMDVLDGPPAPSPEEAAALIRQRIEEHDAGLVKGYTREESAALIRAEMRKLGVELP